MEIVKVSDSSNNLTNSSIFLLKSFSNYPRFVYKSIDHEFICLIAAITLIGRITFKLITWQNNTKNNKANILKQYNWYFWDKINFDCTNNPINCKDWFWNVSIILKQIEISAKNTCECLYEMCWHSNCVDVSAKSMFMSHDTFDMRPKVIKYLLHV